MLKSVFVMFFEAHGLTTIHKVYETRELAENELSLFDEVENNEKWGIEEHNFTTE